MNRQKRVDKYKISKTVFDKTYQIPKDWDLVKLSQIGDVVGGGTPKSSNSKYWNGNILWAIPSDVTNSKDNFLHNTERKITEKGLFDSSAILLPSNSILITSRATIGECVINTKPMATNQGFQNLICGPTVNALFILYSIQQYKKDLLRLSSGTTFYEINNSQMKNFEIPIPDNLKEQKKISSILFNVDTLIQSTQKIIEKTESLKKGMMQKLLTKGIGHKKFKNVKWLFNENVEIPSDWNKRKLCELVDLVTGSTPSTSNPDFYHGDYLWITPPDLDSGKYIEDTQTKLSNKGFDETRKLPKNSIMVTCIGNIGRVGITSKEMSTNQQINSIICNSADFDPNFVYYQIYANKQILQNMANHTVVPILNKTDFGNVEIFIPNKISEQQKIASILSNIDKCIEIHYRYKEKLQQLKKGLMQKLLTGQIRVPLT